MGCQFVIEGVRPVPQGSMTASYNRNTGTSHVHHVQGTALALWRASVREAARAAGATLSLSPIVLKVQFGLYRPKAQTRLVGGKRVPTFRYKDAMPTTAPDLDKLLRAVMDALTGVCYADDSQVVSIETTKMYANTTIVSVDDWKAEGALW